MALFVKVFKTLQDTDIVLIVIFLKIFYREKNMKSILKNVLFLTAMFTGTLKK